MCRLWRPSCFASPASTAPHGPSVASILVPACQQGLRIVLQPNSTFWFCRAAVAPQARVPTTHLAHIPPTLWQRAVYQGVKSRSLVIHTCFMHNVLAGTSLPMLAAGFGSCHFASNPPAAHTDLLISPWRHVQAQTPSCAPEPMAEAAQGQLGCTASAWVSDSCTLATGRCWRRHGAAGGACSQAAAAPEACCCQGEASAAAEWRAAAVWAPPAEWPAAWECPLAAGGAQQVSFVACTVPLLLLARASLPAGVPFLAQGASSELFHV